MKINFPLKKNKFALEHKSNVIKIILILHHFLYFFQRGYPLRIHRYASEYKSISVNGVVFLTYFPISNRSNFHGDVLIWLVDMLLLWINFPRISIWTHILILQVMIFGINHTNSLNPLYFKKIQFCTYQLDYFKKYTHYLKHLGNLFLYCCLYLIIWLENIFPRINSKNTHYLLLHNEIKHA